MFGYIVIFAIGIVIGIFIRKYVNKYFTKNSVEFDEPIDII